MTIIKWIPCDYKADFAAGQINPVVNITHFEPELAFKYLLSTRQDSQFLRCPAVSDLLKNTYVMKCPHDVTLNIDIDVGSIFIDGYDQEFFDSNMTLRTHGKDPATLHFFPKAFFVTESKGPVVLTLFPWFFKKNDVSMVPGSFDISKWIRPVEPAFEIYSSGRYTFKRGEPLYCVKFETPDGKVDLQRGILTNELLDVSRACSDLKLKLPGLNLRAAYKMAEGYVDIMKKRLFKSMDK